MKICGACCEELSKENFSKKQWQLRKYQRRCKDCIAAGKPLELKPPDKPSCWICLEEDPDESGAPIRRECSCRGDSAGFIHVKCITKYAEQKRFDVVDPNSLKNFFEAWKVCPNCKQNYQGDLCIDIASECIKFPGGKETRNTHPWQRKCLFMEAYDIKRQAPLSKLAGHTQGKELRDGIKTVS